MDRGHPNEEGRVSRAEAVHRDLLEALRSGVYRPGDRLREEEVALRLGVSRTPVREALGRLLEKKLVEPAGGRGLVVRRLTTAEVLELYAMRELLEGAAARLAAQHRAETELEALCELQARLSGSGPAATELARLNVLFHAAVVRSARNRYLHQALSELQDAIALLGPTTLSIEGRAVEANVEHDAIIAAIRDCDPDLAEIRARSHTRAALRARLKLLDL